MSDKIKGFLTTGSSVKSFRSLGRMVRSNSVMSTASTDPKLKKLAESIEKLDDEANKSNWKEDLEQARLAVKEFLETTIIGKLYTNFLLVMSVISVLEYISILYLNENRSADLYLLNDLENFEFAIAGLFGLDWIVCFFLAEHKLVFLSR